MVRISPDEVAVADLAAYRVIHSVNDGFPKGKWYMKIVVSMDLKDRIGMFNTTDPKAHAIRRKPFVQGASKSAVLQWEDQIKAKVRTAINKIERDALAGTADILKWWTLMTNDVVCEVAFGESFEALLQEKVQSIRSDGLMERLTVITETRLCSRDGDHHDSHWGHGGVLSTHALGPAPSNPSTPTCAISS